MRMKTKAKRLLKSDTFSSLADNALNSVFRLATGVAIARIAGAEAFASYVLLATAQITVMSWASTYIDTPLLNKASSLPKLERDSITYYSAKRSKRLQGRLALIALACYPLIRYTGMDTITYLGFVASSLCIVSSQFQRARLQTHFKTRTALAADSFSIAVVILGTSLAWIHADQLSSGFWWSSAAGYLIASVFMATRVESPTPTVSFPSLQEEIKKTGQAMIAGSLANTACSRLHPYLIAIASNAATVASYGATLTVLGPMRMAIMALANILRPRLAFHKGQGDRQSFTHLIGNAKRLIVGLGLSLSLFFWVLGPQILDFVFGPEVQVSSVLLVLAVIYATLDAYTTTQMIQIQIQNVNGARQTSRYRIAAAAISIGLALPCIHFLGLYGAFTSLILAEAGYAIMAGRALRNLTAEEPSELRDYEGVSTTAA